jgi:hypothetical protein
VSATIALSLLVAGCAAGGSAKPPRITVLTGAASSTQAVPIAPGQPIVHLAAFRSPGGTITCTITSRAALCTVEHPKWVSDSPCPTAAQQALAISRNGRAQIQCGAAAPRSRGGAALKALPYGTVAQADGFACESYTGGVQCGEQAGGHGFFISRPYRRLF